MAEVPERLRAALADRYDIGEQLGEGGMATVYLANDIKHDRKVAIKVLRPELAAVIGGDRFIAEIRTTASLQHPHILPLFDSGEADSFLYYVMPYVEGESLRDRLDRDKQLPVDEAVRITRAIGSALHYAHERDIVHRDIKPANILMHAGEPIVADFGIAIAISAAGGGRLTETGMSVGTPHYMSPEQASADRDVDARSDTYALACVLYEMLAGDPPHTGPSAQAVLMRILTETPRNITDVRRSVPQHVSDALAKGLEKLAADRFGSAKEFADALADPGFSYHPVVIDATVQALPAVRQAPPSGPTWSRVALPLVGVAAGIALGSLFLPSGSSDNVVDGPATRMLFDLEGLTLELPEILHVSPDGRYFGFVGDEGALDGIFIRGAGELQFRHIPGTAASEFMSFSPDGSSIVFDDADCSLQVSSVSGGASRMILPPMEFGCPMFMRWQEDYILFGGFDDSGPYVARIDPSGGEREVLLDGLNEQAFNYSILPDEETLLYASIAERSVKMATIGTDSSWTLIENAGWAQMMPDGHLAYADLDGGLWVSSFDSRSNELLGAPIPIVSGIVLSGGVVPAVSLSSNGTLVYFQGDPGLGQTAAERLQVVSFSDGSLTEIPVRSRRFRNVRWSPDGSTLAFSALEPGEIVGLASIYLYNLELQTATRRMTDEGTQAFPVWSPDGQRLAYLSALEPDGPNASAMGAILSGDIWAINLDGSGEVQLTREGGQEVPYEWGEDDRILITGGEDTGTSDLLRVPLDGSGDIGTYLDIDGDLGSATLSPDGRYAAFLSSEEVGVNQEIVVRTYPAAGAPIRVSQGGGDRPRWSASGNEIYYWKARTDVDSLMVARVRTSPTFEVLANELVLTGHYDNTATWDLHPDGDRMVIAIPEAQLREDDVDGEPPIYVGVLNWFTEMKRAIGGN